MNSFTLSPEARRDMKQIWHYSFKKWGIVKADEYIRDMNHLLVRLCRWPERGKAVHQIRPGYYRANFESHALFYRDEPEGIFVVRILHQSMDFDRHL